MHGLEYNLDEVTYNAQTSKWQGLRDQHMYAYRSNTQYSRLLGLQLLSRHAVTSQASIKVDMTVYRIYGPDLDISLMLHPRVRVQHWLCDLGRVRSDRHFIRKSASVLGSKPQENIHYCLG